MMILGVVLFLLGSTLLFDLIDRVPDRDPVSDIHRDNVRATAAGCANGPYLFPQPVY